MTPRFNPMTGELEYGQWLGGDPEAQRFITVFAEHPDLLGAAIFAATMRHGEDFVNRVVGDAIANALTMTEKIRTIKDEATKKL